MFEDQVKKTDEALLATENDAEKLAVDSVNEAKHSAIDAFGKAEEAVDSMLQAASTAKNTMLKEADKFIDEKKDSAIKAVTAARDKAYETKEDVSSGVRSKAKDVLNSVKNLGSKAEQLLEKETDAEKLGEENKKLAAEMLEEQVKKTDEALLATKNDAEKLAVDSANEVAKAKEADKFIDEKMDSAIKAVTAARDKAHETKEDVSPGLLSKARGFLNL